MPVKITFSIITALLFFAIPTAAIADKPAKYANEWDSYIQPLLPVGGRLSQQLSDPDDEQLRQEMYRHLYSVTSQAYFGLFFADAKYPAFWPLLNAAYNTLGPNPDDSYYLSPIEDEGIYKISGYRGSVHILSFQVGSGSFFSSGIGPLEPTLSFHNADDLHINENGYFEVILSASKPKGYQGDWWQLKPSASNVLVRQRSKDWLNEVDGRMAIERLDTPAVKPRASAKEIESKLQEIALWAERNTEWAFNVLGSYRKRGMINKVFVHGYPEGGLTTQRYIDGMFELEADEALIYETDVPEQCLYWNIHLTDAMYSSIDWINRQTILNNHTAKIDSDGKFRAIISATDPGAHNWLDTAGYATGMMLGRWLECSSNPVPTITKVKAVDALKYLPADTAMVTPAEREQTIRDKRRAAQMRHKW